MPNREIERLLRKALEQGFTLPNTTPGNRGRGKHIKLYAPDGIGMVTLPKTPSDHRALKNIEAELRRHGYR